jgi:hypothetical protein
MHHDTYQRLLHNPTDVGNGQISVLFPDLLHAGATNTAPCLVGSRLIHAHRLISVPHLSVSKAELRPCWSPSGADINASRVSSRRQSAHQVAALRVIFPILIPSPYPHEDNIIPSMTMLWQVQLFTSSMQDGPVRQERL